MIEQLAIEKKIKIPGGVKTATHVSYDLKIDYLNQAHMYWVYGCFNETGAFVPFQEGVEQMDLSSREYNAVIEKNGGPAVCSLYALISAFRAKQEWAAELPSRIESRKAEAISRVAEGEPVKTVQAWLDDHEYDFSKEYKPG